MLTASRSTPSMPRPARRRSGISLIEVVVACTLLAVSLTALTGVTAKLAKRTRNTALIEQRTATYFQEVNRVESMMYDSLAKYLVTDSVKAGNYYYVWRYQVDAESTSATGSSKYRKVNLMVIPRGDPTATQVGIIRRLKAPTYNPLNN